MRRFLIVLLFFGSCAALVPVGMRVADPMTNVPLHELRGKPFPVVVLTGRTAHVEFLTDSHPSVKLSPGSSFLIPAGQEGAVEAQLNDQWTPGREGGWTLRVTRKDPQHQRIELYWVHDGYSGGGYDASDTAIIPHYYKSTGPGFGIICGVLALVFNAVLWCVGGISVRTWITMKRRSVLPLLGVFLLAGCMMRFIDHMTGEDEANAIRQTGKSAMARVLAISDTGMTLNNDPVVRFRLEVHPEGEEAFEAETQAVIGRLDIPQIQPGAELPVKYDPQDHSRVALDWRQ